MYGIIGNPLVHSWSPSYFTQKFKQLGVPDNYEKFPLNSIEEFPDLLKQIPRLKGLNVTIPFKEKVIPFLDLLSPEAQAIQSVNCISIKEGELTGHNTDILGFETSLNKFLPDNFCSKALILGTGGASKAVEYVLNKKQIPYLLVSRKPILNGLTYLQIDATVLQSHLLIINTTPLGMWPKTNESPKIPYAALSSHHFLLDLIYNPEETLFLKRGKEQGAATQSGLDMLIRQAEESWKIWTAH